MNQTGKSLPGKKPSQWSLSLTLAVVLGQVGCLTLIILLVALFGGLWLDQQFNTKPVITVVLMIASVPVTLILMFWIVRTSTARLQAKINQEQDSSEEDSNRE